MEKTEPFPALDERMNRLLPEETTGTSVEKKVQRRRKSSGLGGEIRAGDTGVPAIATMELKTQSAGLLRAKSERDRKARPYSKRRKAKSLLRRWKNIALKYTWVTPLAILAVFAALYAINPTESNIINRFIFLSYKQPIPAGSPAGTEHKYGKGYWDYAFLSFYIVVLSFTREFIMQMLLRPLAIRCGLRSRAKQSRFMEQVYTAIYFACSGPAGMYVMSRTPVWYFNIVGMYEGFPHRTLAADFKFYYLFQAAYWAQQAIVLLLGMEKPRKDFKELVGHHIVSLLLIGLSYRFHFTYIGLAVYTTHDISDFFLAVSSSAYVLEATTDNQQTSKTLNYIDHPLVGPYFGLFTVVWIYMRHYLNLRILLSLFFEFKTVGPYELNWVTEQYKCDLSHYITAALLGSLQCLNLFWLFSILRIAYRFLFFNALSDERSDAEDDEEFDREMRDEKERAEREKKELSSISGASVPSIQLNGSVEDAEASGVSTTSGAPSVRKSPRRKA
ncbi:hypothetical protein V496_03790 [Pseudogymnoascus sp. VKM F-4515 (FW-2607)]|nr:hypothetical protein V496_03790 [Pseudogymnoascus sp. VKM F-4515 (FW-2607)]KFY82386.1 hypothetical protein V498_08605 [Pseudogymnoascus sp. VKM F-4517 (FW-2822)]